VQCSSSGSGTGVDGDKISQEEADYSGYDGNEYNHDRRPQHHHHHHHHHKNHHHSHHQHHSKYTNSKDDDESNVNHVILITVINPHYPITCDLIHQICSNYGKVNRIVIFKKNGVQAMVEFDNVETAKRARSMLHGCDIYSGCCTLKIEFAKPTRLNVHKNDSESYDYTNPNLGSGTQAAQSASDSSHSDHQHHHQHQQHQSHHHHHQIQQAPSASQHTQYPHGINSHHTKGPGGMGGRRGGGSGADAMNSAQGSGPNHHHHHQHTNQFHPSQHILQTSNSHHQHSKQSMPTLQSQHGGLDQSSGYVMDQTMSESMLNTSDSNDTTFHHQHDGGGFDNQRGNLESDANVAASHQHDFSGSMDTFIPTSTGQQSATHINPHAIHKGMYQQRQDGGHQHHHNQSHQQSHHQSRGRLSGSGSGRGHNHHNPSFNNMGSTNPLLSNSSGGGAAHQGTVLMVYGLSIDRVNCDRLFNLFCLYGNVVRVS
jgi:hypothetical protein